MKTRLASLFLVLMLAGSGLAGVPIHSSKGECGMDGMMGMDCCEAALKQESTPEVANAKLCCALNCAQNGTTSPPKTVRVTSSVPLRVISHPALPVSSPTSLWLQTSDRLHGPPNTGPVYLRNLALLI